VKIEDEDHEYFGPANSRAFGKLLQDELTTTVSGAPETKTLKEGYIVIEPASADVTGETVGKTEENDSAKTVAPTFLAILLTAAHLIL